jgi:hypothetical protein
MRKGVLVVLPTDTVYGIAADAFSPQAVTRLLAAKGRAATCRCPCLIGSWRAGPRTHRRPVGGGRGADRGVLAGAADAGRQAEQRPGLGPR